MKRVLLGGLAALLLGATALYSAGWMWAVRARPTAYGGIDFEVLPRGAIRTVQPGSPAERAGLRAGDRILSVDGRPLDTPTVYHETIFRGRPDQTVVLGVERTRAALFALELRLGPRPPRDPPPPSRLVVEEILASYPLPFLLVATAVLLLRIEDPHAWRLALVFASFIAGAPLFEHALHPALRPFSVAYKVGFQGVNPALFLYFFSVFPAPSALDRRLPWLKWLWLLPGGGLAIGFAAWVYSAGSVHPLEEWVKTATWAEAPVAVYAVAAFALGIAHLVSNALGGAPEVRRKSRIIVWGTVVGTGPVTLLYAAAASLQKPVYEFPFGLWASCVIALALTPLAFAYAVVRHRVLEIPVLLRRSARYLLVQHGSMGLLVALGVAAAVGFSLALGRVAGPRAEAAVAGLSVGFGTVLVWTGSQLHRRVRERIDRAFFRSAYDAKTILQDLAERARSATGREELAGLIERHVRSALLPRTLAVYVESGGALARVLGSDGPARLPSSPALCDLAGDGRPCEVSAWPRTPDALASLSPECLVPLSGRDGSLLGLIALGPRLSEEPYSGEDQRLLASVASQAATALESLRLAEQMTERLEVERRAAHEMELAKRVQIKLLPQTAPVLATLECVGRCVQARAVGGDYYDFLELEGGQLGLALADVSGKGFPAALLMASLQASLRSRALPDLLDLPRQLRAVSQLLYRSSDTNRFATLFLGLYDDSSRRLSYANCGHNPPVLIRAAGPRERLAPTGPALGLLEGWDGEARGLLLAPGDLLAVFSDGITESFDAKDEEFGEERLIALLSAHRGRPLDALADRVFEAVRAFSGGGEQQDDQTLLLARVK